MTNINQNQNTETATINTEEAKHEMETIINNLHIVREQTKELEHALLNLEGKLQYARGTGDITAQANAAVESTQPKARGTGQHQPLRQEPPRARQPKENILHALEGHSMNVANISKTTGITTARVAELVKILKVERKIANVGSEDFPQWTARIGDNTTPSELNAEVKRLVSERPISTQELIDITGARLSRVSGALIALQRGENQLLNLGSSRRARWFLVSDKVVISKLTPKSGPST